MDVTMRYFQIERLLAGNWLQTDWRISGHTPEIAQRHAEEIAPGWEGVRIGREVRPDDHYCDFAWVNLS